jgi:hypothetical protein
MNSDLHDVLGYLEDGPHQLEEEMTLGDALTMMLSWDPERRLRARFSGGPFDVEGLADKAVLSGTDLTDLMRRGPPRYTGG